jgi:hypothetical protein
MKEKGPKHPETSMHKASQIHDRIMTCFPALILMVHLSDVHNYMQITNCVCVCVCSDPVACGSKSCCVKKCFNIKLHCKVGSLKLEILTNFVNDISNIVTKMICLHGLLI